MATSFIWYELMTSDPEAAKAFYSKVVGWQTEKADGPMDYTLFLADGRRVGGLLPTPDEAKAAGAGPVWLGYVGVGDIDSAIRKVTETGGKLHRDIMHIPGTGRIAMIADPQGAALMLIQPEGEAPPAVDPKTPGQIAWHELYTSDWESAFRFYSSQFGWAEVETLDMGPGGKYRLFNAGGEGPIGGMFNADDFGRPAWLFYFAVGDIDEAAERVRSAGGEIVNGPMEVPDGGWIVQCRDPQGALFALAGKRS